MVAIKRSRSPSSSKSPTASPRRNRGLEPGPGTTRHVGQLAAVIEQENWQLAVAFTEFGRLINLRIDMAVDDHEVHIAVEIVVEEGTAPLEDLVDDLLEPQPGADVLELQVAEVAIERRGIVNERGQGDVLKSVAVDVGRVDAHAGLGDTLAIQPRAAPGADLGELSLAVVAVKEVGVLVIGDKDIDIAIVVQVRGEHAQPVRFGSIGHAGLVGGVLEGPVALLKKVSRASA